jgi:hypothetical protein
LFTHRRLSLVAGHVSLITAALVLVLHQAARKPFWYDELFTVLVCSRGSASTIWHLLRTGIDNNPLPFYLLTNLVRHLSSRPEIAFRLPAAFGISLMMCSVFALMAKRAGFFAGIASAVTAALLTFQYGTEARPYALVLGFSSLAIVFWDKASNDPRSRYAAVVFGLALAGALSMHCYAVLILIPFWGAEMARWLSARKVNIPVLSALAITSLIPISYVPLLEGAKHLIVVSGARPEWSQAISWMKYQADLLLVPCLLIALLAIVEKLRQRPDSYVTSRSNLPADHAELALTLLLFALPLFGVALGKTVTGIYTERYGVPSILATSVLLGTIVGKFRINFSKAAVAVSLFVWFFAVQGRRSMPEFPDAIAAKLKAAAETQNAPVAVTDPFLMAQVCYYFPSIAASDMVYVSDPDAATHYSNTSIGDVGMSLLSKDLGLPIQTIPYQNFVHAEAMSSVYGPWGGLAWLPSKLVDDKLSLTVLGVENGRYWFSVRRPAGTESKLQQFPALSAPVLE